MNKVVIVTGASRGIGKEIAKKLKKTSYRIKGRTRKRKNKY